MHKADDKPKGVGELDKEIKASRLDAEGGE
jgi:hypothetical protein